MESAEVQWCIVTMNNVYSCKWLYKLRRNRMSDIIAVIIIIILILNNLIICCIRYKSIEIWCIHVSQEMVFVSLLTLCMYWYCTRRDTGIITWCWLTCVPGNTPKNKPKLETLFLVSVQYIIKGVLNYCGVWEWVMELKTVFAYSVATPFGVANSTRRIVPRSPMQTASGRHPVHHLIRRPAIVTKTLRILKNRFYDTIHLCVYSHPS